MIKLTYQIPFATGVFFFLWGLLSLLDDLLMSSVHLSTAIHIATIGWWLMVMGWSLRSIVIILRRALQNNNHSRSHS